MELQFKNRNRRAKGGRLIDLLGVSVGIVLILHGLLHLQGLIVYLGLGSIGGWPHSTALLYGDVIDRRGR